MILTILLTALNNLAHQNFHDRQAITKGEEKGANYSCFAIGKQAFDMRIPKFCVEFSRFCVDFSRICVNIPNLCAETPLLFDKF